MTGAGTGIRIGVDAVAAIRDLVVRRRRVLAVRVLDMFPGAVDRLGTRIGNRFVVLAGNEPPELARPVEPDEDLAEEPFVPCRFATGFQGLHRDLGHRSRDVVRRERPAVEPLWPDEQPSTRHDVGIAGASRYRVERDVRPRPGDRRKYGPGGQQLENPDNLVIAVLESR